MKNRECEIVQDLIALKGRESRASTRMIAEHVRTCESCRSLYARSRGEFRLKLPYRQAWDEFDTEQRYLRWSIVVIGALAAIICIIVNYAVDNEITWAWIVSGAIVLLVVPVLVYIQTYSFRFIKAMACFSVLTMLELVLTQSILRNGMGIGDVWVWRVAIPVAAIWLGVLWTGILVTMLLKKNGFACIALILLLFIPADIATGAIASGYTGQPFVIHWAAIASYLVAAVLNIIQAVAFDRRGHNVKNSN